ncbi:methylated-DNA-[protein]-cysteine S-methyltransferase [Motilibacter peucedani]|uniref:Methylated-DNA--protein-cysteine methyltransferase n=1 Tax=Motilibacter peucedani TaxID=598650 RepID=A0A420XTC3_9ACTN|nr:methylated-DNA--[protein]-cysteine S-methyltransferase [Motilibacter peucedani]RKS80083.1 methylated-DNA-[protein]-cysteine S-methyltransferase [Motilibacter peucedani]
MSDRKTVVDSPIGPLTLVADDDGLRGVFMESHRHLPAWVEEARLDAAGFDEVLAQLEEYFAGDRKEFDVRLSVTGTPFQRRVWDALVEIPYGSTWSYGQLAAAVGVPGAARAVGLANGRNPVSIIVPCHRVIGASGSLTGYGGGVERKKLLLDLENGVLPL